MRTIISPDQHHSLTSYVGTCCNAFPSRTAFVEEDRAISYGELWERAGALAGFLEQMCGIGRGDRVAVMLPNIIAFPISSIAILRLGAVQVNINPFYTARELRHQLDDADVGIVIAGKGALPALTGAAPASLHTILLTDTPVEATTPPASAHGPIRLFALQDALMAGFIPAKAAGTEEAADLAFLQYTGGTTGLSKGAMLSHGNILANVGQLLTMGQSHFHAHPITVLTAIPLYHIFALTVNMFSMFALGAENILIPDPRNISALVSQWSRHRINFITGVNTLFKGLCADRDFAALGFAPELVAMGGGAAVQEIVSERWRALTGRHIREGYGLSETSPILTCTPFEEERFLGSIGKAVPGTELSVRDIDGRPLGPGEVGELCARGPQVMSGYWKRPDATAEAMTADGFFRTGDMARLDEEGRYYIVDRQKDMILVSGFNVYPNEVEAVVAEIPGVAECACVGHPDTASGEAVAMFVVRSDESLDEQRIRDHCRQNLAAYKVPRHVYFITDMPKTNVGKILRRDLRARLPQETKTGA